MDVLFVLVYGCPFCSFFLFFLFLYRLERAIKGESVAERYAQRQKIALPLLADLKRWLEKNVVKAEKGGLTHKAIYYALNQWDKLVRYCDDGRFAISNTGAENAIRPFAVGRRRWLFCDTPKGAKASAIHYSLIETCKANDINPEAYYRYILPRIPEADTVGVFQGEGSSSKNLAEKF